MPQSPPRRALHFLRWFCREDFLEEIEGDLVELFELQYQESPRRARRAFIWQVLRHFRPDFIKSFSSQPIIHSAMIRHNLLITYRGFLRNKSSFLINLVGISTGLACVLFIYLWIDDELKMDAFHEKGDRLYQVMNHMDLGETIKTFDRSPVPLANALKAEFPEVEYAVSTNDFFSWNSREGVLKHEDKLMKATGIHASQDFFKVFSYPLRSGNPAEVLTKKDHIVISVMLAKNIFGSEADAIGKMIEWDHPNISGIYQVSGVFETLPANSTQQFDVIFSIEVLLEKDNWAGNWTGNYAETFLVIKEGVDIKAFNQKISRYLETKNEVLTAFTLFVQKYSDRYLYNTYEAGIQTGGRISYVRLFSLLALFILLIACVNFMNLSTAKAAVKMKEIGVKKTIGAMRVSLIIQLLGESVLMTFISLLVAMVLVQTLIPHFNVLTGKELFFQLDWQASWVLLGIVLFTGIIAGSYPAFYLSGFQPITVLKGKLPENLGNTWLRKGLVVFQFTLSVIFILGLLVLNRQIDYTQQKNLGYDRDNVIQFTWKGELYNPWDQKPEGATNEKFYAFMDRLKTTPGVKHASNMVGSIISELYGQGGISWEGLPEGKAYSFKSPVIGEGMIETLGIPVVRGRSFSLAHNDDYQKVVINESAAAFMGYEDPVGMRIRLNGESEIIGVVKDFHYGSLHNPLEPMFFRFEPHGPNVLVKVGNTGIPSTIERIEALHEEFMPGFGFDYQFMDDEYQQMYESETRVASLSNYFAGLAIIISCLGLLGLVAFTAERRQKEIGIRKVMGATLRQLVFLLSKEFTKMVLLAIVVALPIAYVLAQNWLENFADRIPLRLWYFIAAAGLTLLIAVMTVGFQTLKFARINPVECLKDE